MGLKALGKMTRLDRKIAVVIGGSSGIGAASARMLAYAGAAVAIGYHHGLSRAAALVSEFGSDRHSIFPIDVNDEQSVSQAAETVERHHGRVDILVNSAGKTQLVPHAELNRLDDRLWDEILTGNLRGPFSAIRAFAPLLKKTGDGVIVNISSISGFTGSGSNVAYCASKAGLDTMTLSLARALGPEIRVLCVSPGAVATDFVAGRDRAALEKIAQNTPLKRVIEPEDVARAVMACITHLTASTGARIIVDGGRFLM